MTILALPIVRPDMGQPDGEIVERVRGGDANAYRALVERYYPRCLRYAGRMLGQRADAEDAVQNTFHRAYRSLHTFEASRAFDAWLFQILVNQCRDVLSLRKKRGEVVTIDDIELFSTDSEAPTALRLDLAKALDALQPLYREAVLLKFIEDLTYEEMANQTGATISALKMRVQRALQSMEQLLGGGTRDRT